MTCASMRARHTGGEPGKRMLSQWLQAHDFEMWIVAYILVSVGGALLGYLVARLSAREELISYQLNEVHARGRIEHLEADNAKLHARAAIAESRWERVAAVAQSELVAAEDKRQGRKIIAALDPPKPTDWKQNSMRLGMGNASRETMQRSEEEPTNGEAGQARRAASLNPILDHGGPAQEPPLHVGQPREQGAAQVQAGAGSTPEPA